MSKVVANEVFRTRVVSKWCRKLERLFVDGGQCLQRSYHVLLRHRIRQRIDNRLLSLLLQVKEFGIGKPSSGWHERASRLALNPLNFHSGRANCYTTNLARERAIEPDT